MRTHRSSGAIRPNGLGALIVAVPFGTAIVWAVVQYGATEASTLYSVVLLLIVTALVAVAWSPGRLLRDRRLIPLALTGSYLLFHAAVKPTLEAEGYVVALVGWLSLFLTLWLVDRGPTAVWGLAGFLIAIGVVEGLYGIGQAIGPFEGGDFFGKRIANGTMVNYAHYAALLDMTLLLAVGLMVSSSPARRDSRPASEHLARTWIMNLGCAIAGVAVLLSGSRGGAIALVLSLALITLLLVLRRRFGSGGSSTLWGWVLLLTLLVLGGVFGIDLLLGKFARIQQDSRPVLFRESLTLIAEHPLIGVGPGMYASNIREHQTVVLWKQYGHAHNDYLEIAADWGIPLAVLFWGFIAWRFYRATRLFLRARERLRSGLSLGCAAAIFSILVHSLVNFNLHIPGNLMVFCTIVGLGWGMERSAEPPHAES